MREGEREKRKGEKKGRMEREGERVCTLQQAFCSVLSREKMLRPLPGVAVKPCLLWACESPILHSTLCPPFPSAQHHAPSWPLCSALAPCLQSSIFLPANLGCQAPPLQASCSGSLEGIPPALGPVRMKDSSEAGSVWFLSPICPLFSFSRLLSLLVSFSPHLLFSGYGAPVYPCCIPKETLDQGFCLCLS